MNIRGEHVILDVKFNNFPNDLKDMVNLALNNNKVKVVDYMEHIFEPQGVTACWVLAASSFVMHSYPEENYVSMDCYTCDGEGSALRVIDDIVFNYHNNIDKLLLKKLNRGDL